MGMLMRRNKERPLRRVWHSYRCAPACPDACHKACCHALLQGSGKALASAKQAPEPTADQSVPPRNRIQRISASAS